MLLALFGPLSLVVAQLSAWPLTCRARRCDASAAGTTVLLALFGPLSLVVAQLSAWPLTGRARPCDASAAGTTALLAPALARTVRAGRRGTTASAGAAAP